MMNRQRCADFLCSHQEHDCNECAGCATFEESSVLFQLYIFIPKNNLGTGRGARKSLRFLQLTFNVPFQ